MKLQQQQLQKQTPVLSELHGRGKSKSMVFLAVDSSHPKVFPTEVCDSLTAFGCSLDAPQLSLKPFMINSYILNVTGDEPLGCGGTSVYIPDPPCKQQHSGQILGTVRHR